jgi:hypothetical protein
MRDEVCPFDIDISRCIDIAQLHEGFRYQVHSRDAVYDGEWRDCGELPRKRQFGVLPLHCEGSFSIHATAMSLKARPVEEAIVSKTQKATMIPKSSREETRHSVRSSAVGKSKFQPATWIAVNSNVAKHSRYSCMPYGFVGKRSFGMRCIGRSEGMTGIFMNGLDMYVSTAHFTL